MLINFFHNIVWKKKDYCYCIFVGLLCYRFLFFGGGWGLGESGYEISIQQQKINVSKGLCHIYGVRQSLPGK